MIYCYVITHRVKDYPGKAVLRRHLLVDGEVVPDGNPLVIADSVEKARAFLPPGVVSMPLVEQDDPSIAEWWM